MRWLQKQHDCDLRSRMNLWSTKRMCNGPGEWDKVAYYELWKTSLLGKTTIQMKRRIYDDDADTYSLMAVSDGSYDIDGCII